MAKNLRKRPLMKWQVMDMTQTKVCAALGSSASHSGRALLQHPIPIPRQCKPALPSCLIIPLA